MPVLTAPRAAIGLLLAAACCATPSRASAQTVDGGRFGRALEVKDAYAFAAHNPVYVVAPLTVECWAKLGGSSNDNNQTLLANEPRHSVNHWEVFAEKGTGFLCASMPGYQPPVVKSTTSVTDGKWHHVAMVFDSKALRLHVDAKQVGAADVKKAKPYPDTGPLTFGFAGDAPAGPGTLIDEVRLSSVVRPLDQVPDAPFKPDADTIGLWHFDEDAAGYEAKGFADASRTRNAARLRGMTETDGTVGGFDGTRAVAPGKTRWSDMDYGPFFSSTLKVPGQKDVVPKAISIRLGPDRKHAVAFDTETLRMAAAWEGEFLKIGAFREGLGGPPEVGGKVLFSTRPGPGWAKPGTEDFTDPRPDKSGPLPKEWAKYKGLYVADGRVVLKYSVGETDVLEAFGLENLAGVDALTRTLELAPHEKPLSLVVCDVPGATVDRVGDAGKQQSALLNKGGDVVVAAVRGAPAGAAWKVVADGRLLLALPPAADVAHVKLTLWHRGQSDPLQAAKFEPIASLSPQTTSPPRRESQPIITKGELGKESKSDPAYVVDTLTAPDDNPWKSFLRFGGHDFFANGDAALCSVSGDVWVVGGIDDKLESLKWRRYATGLFQPLGLKIVDDKVYVLGRDQITRLHELNADGEADFYENFNNDAKVTANGHAYVIGLETDLAGNFYYAKCGDRTEHGGTVLRVSKDGSKLDVVATGVRNTNGIGAGPDGTITHADNQGDWVPASRIDLVTPGGFLGYQPMSKASKPPTDPGKPIIWMPQNVDNSSGGQVWVTSDKWGPFQGQMLHTSYGAAALLHVMTEQVDGVTQGGVYRFPLNFATGIMRGRFRPQDGQLYLSGLRGWQTAGVRDGAFQRVRYTGKPVRQPASLNVHQNGIRLGFTCPLDKEVAEDPESYGILQWNYKWQAEYGSKQWSVKDPTRQGYDTVEVKSARLLPDGKTVFLEIDGLRPVMQMKVSVDLESADGATLRQDVYNTIHALGAPFAAPTTAGK